VRLIEVYPTLVRVIMIVATKLTTRKCLIKGELLIHLNLYKMNKLENFKEFEENNLAALIGGAEYTYSPTKDLDGGHDEYQNTQESSGSYIDGLYDCDEGRFVPLSLGGKPSSSKNSATAMLSF
jgi:hypothetical protein